MSIPHSEPSSDEPGFFPLPVPLVRALQIVGWDGVLPLFVALAPPVCKAIWPKPPLAVGAVLVLAPPVAALIRAHIGWHQIARRCGGHAPWWRQVTMAIAILLLLGFEASVGILTFGKDLPGSAWWIPIGVYAGYFAVISLTLWTPRVRPGLLRETEVGEQI